MLVGDGWKDPADADVHPRKCKSCSTIEEDEGDNPKGPKILRSGMGKGWEEIPVGLIPETQTELHLRKQVNSSTKICQVLKQLSETQERMAQGVWTMAESLHDITWYLVLSMGMEDVPQDGPSEPNVEEVFGKPGGLPCEGGLEWKAGQGWM